MFVRVLATLTLAGATALVAMPTAEPAQQMLVRPKGEGLCHRAQPLKPLPPERAVSPQQDRWGSRGRTGRIVAESAVPPPPAAPPLKMAAPESEAITVTGSAARGEARATAAPAPSIPPSAFPRRPQPRPQSGLLTAGEHDDLLNPELYARYVDQFLKTETLDGVPRLDTRRVLTVAVQDAGGRAMPFVPVTLTCADGNTLTLSTLADGTVAFFPELDRLGRAVRMTVPGGGARAIAIDPRAGGQRQTVTLTRAPAPVRRFDLALVLDTTGSMGDEIAYLKAELGAVLDSLRRRHPGIDVRLALVAYRDEGDDYVTRTYPFTTSQPTMQANLRAQEANGGGDYPEAVEQAMARAMALEWRPDAVKSLLFVADAPPHAEDVAASWQAAEWARARRIQIVPVAASGVAEGAEYLMRAMAAATQSRYLFLTDDSGIGNPHAPPAIDCYLVTRLDHALRRVLDGQLSGRRIEPAPGEVIRSVGDYDAGRCRLPRDFPYRQ